MTIKEFLVKEIAWRKELLDNPDPNIMVMDLAHEEVVMRAYERALEAETVGN